MADIPYADAEQRFARAFGDALKGYFDKRGTGPTEAANLLGLDKKNGRMRVNSYFSDSRTTEKRPVVGGHVFYLACTKLPRFRFEFDGYKISAVKVNGRGKGEPAGQMSFNFHGRFALADDAGNVDVRVKKPNGSIEVLVSLDAKAALRSQE